MLKLLRNFYAAILITATINLFAIGALNAEPMDDVFSMLENGGGTRSGKNKIDGYYVVAMGTSSRSNENKGLEEARMGALRQLSEMINGVTMSGNTSASMKYITVSDENGTREFSRESFVDVVNTSFKGQLSAAKQLKSGQYDGDYFVAIVITQTDLKQAASLRSTANSGNSHSGNTIIIATDASNQSIAQVKQGAKTVESKGLASMKVGETEARKKALNDAIHNAVQQAQGVMMQGKSGKFNDAIAVAISTKTEGYVSSYEMLDEDISRGQYYVIIEAIVDASKLLNDVNFYTQVLGQPVFSINSENDKKSDWMIDELERLGFTINDGKKKATHTFYLKQRQSNVEDHKGSKGIETTLSIVLKDNKNGNILFTINNNPMKTRIYVQPVSRAKQVSEHVAYKQMKKKMGVEVIQSLARHAEKGIVYQIVLKNAKQTDVDIFKHVLNNGTSGNVETWKWDKKYKTMTLDYRFSGPLSEAFDQSLKEIYSTFKKEGKGRRPHMKKVDSDAAYFDIVRS